MRKILLKPAIRLLDHFTYSRKLVFLGILVLLAIFSLSTVLYIQSEQDVIGAKLQLHGLEQIIAVNRVVQLAQQYRGLSVASRNRNSKIFFSDYNKKQLQTELALHELISSLDPKMSLKSGDLGDLWGKLKSNNQQLSLEQQFNEHTHFIKKLQLLPHVIADYYGYFDNSDASIYYLLDNILNAIPDMTEDTSQARAIVTSILTGNTLSKFQRAALVHLVSTLDSAHSRFNYNLARARLKLPKLSIELLSFQEQQNSTTDISNIINGLIFTKQYNIKPEIFFSEVTKDIDSIYDLMYQKFSPELHTYLEQIITRASLKRNLVLFFSILLFIIILYILFSIYRSLLGNIRHISKTVNDYASGNKDARIKIKSKDEMRDISIAINNMAERLNTSRALIDFQQHAFDQHAIVSVTDIRGIITEVNDKFLHISQFSRGELIGENHRIVNSDFHPKFFFEDMWRIISSGKVWHGEIQNRAKDGSVYWVSSTIVPQLNDRGEPERYIAIRTDVTHIKKMEEQQIEANRLLRAGQQVTIQGALRLDTIINTAMDAAIQIDAEGLIIGWNKQAENIFGWLKDEAMGCEMHTLIIPERYREQHLQGVKGCLSTGESSFFNKPIEISALNSKGIEFPIEIAISIVSYNDQYQFSAFIRDLTKQKEYEKSILDSQYQANKANKAKSEFLSSMSHELRTPLNAILGFGQLLESYSKQPLTKDQKESVNFILSSGNHLLNLVNDVLELSAIEAGKLKISSEPIHLLALVTDIETLITPMTVKANIELNIESKEELIAFADYTKLKQVLINLINNAIKYNKQNGSVTINWASTEHNTFKLNVVDTGIGISENKRNEVFGAFNRLGQETSSIEGTGIGLVVTKNLVEMMGGQIGFNSTAGQGSTFWVELPLAESQSIEEVNAPQPEKKEENAVITKSENKQVLYVEDNPTNRRLMQSVFAQQPYTLKMVESGELGIETALAHNFDLVLMDINLPGIDGKEVAKQLRVTEYYKNIPILAVTAAAMKHDIESAEGLFDNYITKPLDILQLISTLNKYL